MRLLHTSDWHLGRTLHGVSLAEAQEAAVQAVIETAIAERVDAVIVAGDVFDRAVPSVEALRLLNRAILALDAAGIVAIIASGNHDSGDRLATYAGVLRDSVHLVGSLDRVGEAIELTDAHGSVLVYPMPYLEPDVARVQLASDGEPLERSHTAVIEAALDRIAAHRATRPGARAVIVGHAFVADVAAQAVESDSERDLTVGGIAIVPASVFVGRELDYVALGHLHRAQVVRDAQPHVRYSGSLLRYSFSEAAHEKSVVIVDLGAPGSDPVIELVALPQPRGMRRLRGTIDELVSDAFADARDDFVELVVTDAHYPDRMHARLDEVFPFALRKEHSPEGRREPVAGAVQVARTGRDPVDLMLDFLTRVTGEEPTTEAIDIVRSAYEDVRGQAV